MKKQFLEAGKIVNTHGVAGEVKVQSWCDSPEVLLDFDTLYLSPTEPVQVKKSYVHKNCVIMRLEGVDTCEAAEALKNRVLYLDREDVELPDDWCLSRIFWGWRYSTCAPGRPSASCVTSIKELGMTCISSSATGSRMR